VRPMCEVQVETHVQGARRRHKMHEVHHRVPGLLLERRIATRDSEGWVGERANLKEVLKTESGYAGHFKVREDV
jgi:hypothetical protein